MALGLPRLLAPVLPTTYSPRYSPLAKAHVKHEHLEYPYHALAHCKGFAPAAPRRARSSISVTFSRLPLSWPLQILGLVGRYLTNCLICRRLILRRCLSEINHFQNKFPISYYPQFPKAITNLRADYRRVTERSAGGLATP